MVSSDVFGTSPLGDTRRQPLHLDSSSPDLPSLRDVLTTKATSQPSVYNGSGAEALSRDGPSGFISARQLYPTTESAPKVVSKPSTGLHWALPNPGEAARLAEDASGNGGFIAGDNEPPKEREEHIEVIKITGKSTRKPRQQKVSKQAAPKRAAKRKPATKKQSSKAASKDHSPAEDNDDDKQKKVKAAKPRKKTGTMSNHFPPEEESKDAEKAKQSDVNEPLHLEQAPARRLDWTPPAQRTMVDIDSDSSVFKKLGSSEADQQPVFKNLVEDYSCMEGPNELTSHSITNASDEDSSFLKKRKRIRLLATKGTDTPAMAPDKSPAKKAPKKKRPRTITELATAAYRVPSQPDTEPPNASILDHFPTTNKDTGSLTDEQPKNAKGKSTSRRKPSKAPKKKVAPKPVLLSPSAALAQVANQDFVFGTSSQLAREESPTVLRDLQAALRQSNQHHDIDFTIPMNSDAIESPQERSNLWDAAARDAEGDLFDVEVINLADDTGLSEVGHVTNSFGYQLGADDSVICVESRVLNDRIPPAKPCDDIPSPDEKDLFDSGAGSPYFSDSELSTGTDIHRPLLAQTEVNQANQMTAAEEPESLPELPAQPPRPNYEAFTDIRLAREIKRFGFKPIKRRSAMIALLDQCWQSKSRMGQASLHTSTKLSSPTKTTRARSPATTSSPKKPRGRPRENSINAPEPQEPPPSAQPPETPKRPRGRPRKDSLSSVPDAASPSKPKAAAKPKRAAVSPRRKKATAKSVIEIPDSEDNESDFASSPDTNAEQMFSSPPPLDMSLTTNDGTPLTATQSDQEALLFDHITNAVTSAPRTTDPHEPSWHEKILIYDPIVLEDLAAWLNTGELSRVGYDGEVNPNDVKKWCESKSICCLWRISLRGKERKRF
ncbi:structure-specific endonuclease subunit SLX4 [Fusarium denticulatum]|uniref:Structure-specific endonuclease subunit SLX4 n=1 Tax=Fusarium denticulatum TaxID=48507 RepID=A0A8H5T600_9HYPO|nr:structure-specific endonuclease subunit SLX4 [Fusarium denticulatum]